MTMRKLASIRTVNEVKPIAGADRIELAVVGGWQCVVKKGEFRAGELGVYFEIDSFLPVRPEFEFLRASSYKKLINDEEGFRLRTVRMRGQLSQGLMMPLSSVLDEKHFEEGEDVTELLSVKKWEPGVQVMMQGDMKGPFPSFILRTDEERVQNLRGHTMLPGLYTVTEKLDGTSATFFLYRGEFGVCSRNWELKDGGNVFWNMARKYDIEAKLRAGFFDVAVQAEIVGPRIQGNSYKLKEPDMAVFSVQRLSDDAPVFFPTISQAAFCEQHGFPHVPMLDCYTVQSADDVAAILALADGQSAVGDMPREGLVFRRPIGEAPGKFGFKAISNAWLLNEK